MLKQHNIENFEVPMPIEDNAPNELIEQHKAVVMAESTTRASRGAKARKKSHTELDLTRPHGVEQDFPSLHHTSMVTSTYSTVSLRDIDPIVTMHAGEHHLLQHAGTAHDNPSTPTAIHPRPPQAADETALRVNEHDASKQEYAVPDMGRNVLEMGRVVVSDMQRNAVQDLARSGNVHDMARRNIQEMARVSVSEMQHGQISEMARNSGAEISRGEDIARGAAQMPRPEMNRPVQDLNRSVSDLTRTVPELRMKAPEIARTIADMSRNAQEISRRGHPEMSRNNEMVTNIMVPTSHTDRPVMVSAAHPDRSNVMPVTSPAERQNIMVPTSHAERGRF